MRASKARARVGLLALGQHRDESPCCATPATSCASMNRRVGSVARRRVGLVDLVLGGAARDALERAEHAADTARRSSRGRPRSALEHVARIAPQLSALHAPGGSGGWTRRTHRRRGLGSRAHGRSGGATGEQKDRKRDRQKAGQRHLTTLARTHSHQAISAGIRHLSSVAFCGIYMCALVRRSGRGQRGQELGAGRAIPDFVASDGLGRGDES